MSKKIFLSTVECYDAWSSTYDSDGNVLQMIDDVAFDEFVQPLLNFQKSSSRFACELGCGTGRNTKKLVDAEFSVIGVDVSKGMLSKAAERLASVSWKIHDLNSDEELNVDDSSIDVVISTLLIEHIVSLDRYFRTIYRILKKTNESWAWISAMHPQMFRHGSQAAFVSNSTTKEKFCGVSFDHSIDEIIESAERNHLKMIRRVEKSVENAEEAQKFGPRATKWIGKKIFLAFLFRIV